MSQHTDETDDHKDTGIRPFVCKRCQRSFTRQDSLARHEKLHLRKASAALNASSPRRASTPIHAGLPISPAQSISDGSSTSAAPPIDATPGNDWTQQSVQDVTLDGFDTSAADLDFQLMWPDSENLFQTIMSSDVNSWPMPLGLLPFPPHSDAGSLASFESPALSVPTGESQQAVQDVSQMITNLVSQKRIKGCERPSDIVPVKQRHS